LSESAKASISTAAGRQVHVCRETLDLALAAQASFSLAAQDGVPHVDPGRFRFPEAPASLLGLPAMRRHRVVPLYRGAAGVVVATDNPLDREALQRLRFVLQARVLPVFAARETLAFTIEALERADAASAAAAPDGAAAAAPEPWLPAEAFEAPEAPAQVTGDDNEVVQLVNRVIADAQALGASDIHLEPRGAELQVRLRRDGVLHEFTTVRADAAGAMLSRIKVMASLDISERRKAQDGKIRFRRPGAAELELRVATIPLNNGQEAAVLRLLSSARALPMEALGLEAETMRSLARVVEEPHGLILVCGPTGSGKTTTLHSLLALLNNGTRKIWTAEDPVEITQAGLSQVQVNARIGWTFAAALRAFLRADPDVVMVGEMRDRETAATAVEASLTGHLVMSTLHTNGAAEAATRLIDMGLDPFSSSDALIGVLAQRLVRRVCQQCALIAPAAADELEVFRLEYLYDGVEDGGALELPDRFAMRIARPRGCAACGHTGYKGRIGLYEWMPVTPAVRSRLQRRATAEEVRACAVAEGMRTLRQDGIEKALKSFTTLEQVRAVCGLPEPRRQQFGRRATDPARARS
jgi:type II secretory ATPase GspE/PulE/Tfp pilus assembly ATPase PilB-like protein